MAGILSFNKLVDSGLKYFLKSNRASSHVSGVDTRFTPEPLREEVKDIENEDTWGFADTQFEMRSNGDVFLTGTRYELSNQRLSSFVPWIEGVMGFKVEVSDKNDWTYPCRVPKAIRNEKFLEELALFLNSNQWSEDARLRLRRGHGHTQEEMFAIKYGHLERIPDLVVWPSDEEQVEKIVASANKHNVVLIPYGGGTNVTDALRCSENEKRTIVSVDMRKMDKVLWIDPVNRMAFIQAGAVGRNIQKSLAKYGWTMGHEPDSSEFSTLGGWIATNASGMKKNRYGNIEDLVVDVHAVTNQGVLQRSAVGPRESIGIDPRRWLFGSEGTMGIITGAVVKLFPLPAEQRYGSVLFPNFEAGIAFLYELGAAGNWPASVRLMDNLQFQFGQALKPKAEGLKTYKSKIEKAFVTKIKGFDPQKMVACTLVFEGTKSEVESQEELVYSIAEKFQGMKAGAENGARGYMLTYSIAYIRDFVMKHWVLAESFETSVPWSQVSALCENVKQRVRDEHAKRNLPGNPFITCRVTQIYETGVAVYFYFAFHYKGVENPTEVYHEIENAARDEILKNGGSLSHHHGVGKLRRDFLPRVMSDASLRWRSGAKLALDPKDIFASGNQLPENYLSLSEINTFEDANTPGTKLSATLQSDLSL